MTKVILNLDESGNLGSDGRYFTIACIETTNVKPLINVMKKTELKTKQTFEKFKNADEIKANEAFPLIKDYYYRKIASKDIAIRYVTADKPYVKSRLLEDENLLYNYMLQFIIVPIARKQNVKALDIYLDNRSIKVKSANSFQEYISIKLNYELNLNVDLNVQYVESKNSYPVQAADFVANAVNAYYEHGYTPYFDILKPKIIQHEKFPINYFGKPINANDNSIIINR